MLRRLQRCGHRPVLVLGGGTTLVGDPSGRDKSREMLSPDTIERNASSIARAFGSFVRVRGSEGGGNDGRTAALVVNNAEWLGGLHLLPFLRDVGAHFPMSF